MLKKIKSFVFKIGNRGKALICGAIATVSSCAMAAVASASDATSSSGTDFTTVVEQAGNSIAEQFSAFVSTSIPVLIGILMSGLGIYAVFILIKLAKKAFGSVTS